MPKQDENDPSCSNHTCAALHLETVARSCTSLARSCRVHTVQPLPVPTDKTSVNIFVSDYVVGP